MRASKKLKSDELLLTGFAASRLRMELDRVPLWRGNHVPVKQLAEDFARYIYLPRLKTSDVLLSAVKDGVSLSTWEQDGFAFADSYDEAAGRYRGLRLQQSVSLFDAAAPGILVKSEIARKQIDAETHKPPTGPLAQPAAGSTTIQPPVTAPGVNPTSSSLPSPITSTQPKRFHGTVVLDSTRVGRDASRIAEEVIAHLSGLVGANVTVTIEIEAEIPNGAPDHVVRTVTENSRTLKFTNQGFEKE